MLLQNTYNKIKDDSSKDQLSKILKQIIDNSEFAFMFNDIECYYISDDLIGYSKIQLLLLDINTGIILIKNKFRNIDVDYLNVLLYHEEGHLKDSRSIMGSVANLDSMKFILDSDIFADAYAATKLGCKKVLIVLKSELLYFMNIHPKDIALIATIIYSLRIRIKKIERLQLTS